MNTDGFFSQTQLSKLLHKGICVPNYKKIDKILWQQELRYKTNKQGSLIISWAQVWMITLIDQAFWPI